MNLKALVLILALAPFMQHCPAKVEGLYVSDVFNYDNTKRDGIMIGGVTSAAKALDQETSSNYGNILSAKIRDERKEIKTLPYSQFAAAVDKKTSDAATEEFRSTGGLKPQTITSLATKLPSVRFLALSRIESDVTNTSRHDTPAQQYKDSSGRMRYEAGSIVVSAEREMRVLLSVFDLKQKDVAFSGTVTKSASRSNSHTVNTVSSIVSIVQSSKGNDPYPAPEAPPQFEVLGAVYKGFAQNFPEED
jgi:hypothetical protein